MADQPSDKWLQVRGWFRQAMQPAGADLSAAILDRLTTDRPVIVFSTDYHSVAANTKAITLAGVTEGSPNPPSGSIARDADGKITGIFEDFATSLLTAAVPAPSDEEVVRLTDENLNAALAELARQGVTSVFGAASVPTEMAGFRRQADSGTLTVRTTLAPIFTPEDVASPAKVVDTVKGFAKDYGVAGTAKVPGISIHTAKIFLDGVVQAPAQTGAVLEPYLVNHGDAEHPDWQPGDKRGELYVEEDALTAALTELAKAGLDVHLHTDADRAVNTALNAIERVRKAVPDSDFRPGLAHCELMHTADFARFAALDVFPVLSFQWGKPAPDTILTVRDYIGEERFKNLETAGKFAAASADVVFGSDWPVDPLDEWFAMEVGVTRMNEDPAFPGRLGDDPGLDIKTALRAFTINAARSLRMEDQIGSLEPGKFADFIVLDRDPTQIDPKDIIETRVMETWLGGRKIYAATP